MYACYSDGRVGKQEHEIYRKLENLILVFSSTKFLLMGFVEMTCVFLLSKWYLNLNNLQISGSVDAHKSLAYCFCVFAYIYFSIFVENSKGKYISPFHDIPLFAGPNEVNMSVVFLFVEILGERRQQSWNPALICTFS